MDPREAASSAGPAVSVIIPAHQDRDLFRRCLSGVARATPSAHEVIVAIGGDPSDLWGPADEIGARVVSVSEPAGPAQLRNLGARAAHGDILFFIDGDVAMHADAVGRVIAAFQHEPNLAAVIGSYDDEPDIIRRGLPPSGELCVMSEKPYHKYVFDTGTRKFIGEFEAMYRHEDAEGYDSWFQEDLRHLNRQLSLVLLQRYNFGRILDLGCGKGDFTHLLKKANNKVIGVDVSQTAILKARAKYPDVDFRALDAGQLGALTDGPFDLVVAMEVLSYLDGWRNVLRTVSTITRYLYLTLYLPAAPIGYVKSFEELRAEISRYFVVETELLLNGETILLLAKVKE